MQFKKLVAAVSGAVFLMAGQLALADSTNDLVDALVPGAAGAQESLSRAHNARNKADYDGDDFDVTEGLVEDVVEGVKNVKEEVDLMLKQLAKSAPPAGR